MFGLTMLDVSSYLGLAAVGAFAVNLLLGMLISLRYSPKRLWPHCGINIFALHTWTAYTALALTFAHPAALLLAHSVRFRLIDVLMPVASPVQPTVNSLGAIAAYLVLLVVVTSVFRTRMARPLWKRLHYLVFPAALLLMAHSVLTDPSVTTGRPDYLDGGKVFLYIALAVMAAAAVTRYQLRDSGLRQAREKVIAKQGA
jgi:predicted ferric reductase